jgi:hypothetical protein
MLGDIIIGGRTAIIPILPPAHAWGRKANMVTPAAADQNKRLIKVAITSLSFDNPFYLATLMQVA